MIKVEVQSLSARNPGRPVSLVLDDLSILMSVGVEIEEVISFVRYCERLLQEV